jgi:hypothetical protein
VNPIDFALEPNGPSENEHGQDAKGVPVFVIVSKVPGIGVDLVQIGAPHLSRRLELQNHQDSRPE